MFLADDVDGVRRNPSVGREHAYDQ